VAAENAPSNSGRALSGSPEELITRPRSRPRRTPSSGGSVALSREPRISRADSNLPWRPSARATCVRRTSRSAPEADSAAARNRCSLADGSSKSHSESTVAWWAWARAIRSRSFRAAGRRRRPGS
jgi:hypothetical protein